jgi:hypothetical protein
VKPNIRIARGQPTTVDIHIIHLPRGIKTPLSAKRSYVIRVSNPKTKAELAELTAATAEGRKVAVMPHQVATSAEWIAKYGPNGE